MSRLHSVVIDGVGYSSEDVASMSFEQFKELVSFCETENMALRIAKWHSEDAVQYVECVFIY